MVNIKEWSKQANIIADVLSKVPKFDKTLRVEKPEFQRRQKAVYEALKKAGFDGGIVYSDEHYHGDVPYLGGNTNISVEPVAGIVGKKRLFYHCRPRGLLCCRTAFCEKRL